MRLKLVITPSYLSMQEKISYFSKKNNILFVILVLSVLLRIASAFYLGDTVEILPGTYDQVSYHELALRVIDGHGFTFGQPWWPITAADAPTAHWSYLYTSYLVVIYTIFGPHPLAARLIQALIVGLLQPFLAYLIARRIFGEIVGLVAAALTTLYVYFIYYTAALMTESFYITAIFGVLYLSVCIVDHAAAPNHQKSRNKYFILAVILGLTLGTAVLLRQLFLLFIPFLFLWIGWVSHKRGGRWIVPALFISGMMIVFLVIPITIFNYVRFERFVLLNTNAGYAFFWANHPIYGTNFEPLLPPEMGTYQSLIPDKLRHLDEAALDQALLIRGLQFVFQDPIRYVRLSLSRIPIYFKFWPSANSSLISNISRVTSFGLFFPFMLYGLFLAFFNKDRQGLQSETSSPAAHSSSVLKFNISSPLFLLAIFVLIYTAIHILSWALIRYRLPVDAVLLVFAALALVDIAKRMGIARWLTRYVN